MSKADHEALVEAVARASFATWRQRMIDTGQRPEAVHSSFEDMQGSELEFAYMHARAALKAQAAWIVAELEKAG